MELAVRVRGSADATVQAGTARLEMTSTTIDHQPAHMVGTVDFLRRRSWSQLHLPPDVTGTDPDGVDRTGPATAPDARPLLVEAVVDGADLYLEVVELPGRWLRSRLDAHDDDMPPGDPGLLLDWLRGCTHATEAQVARDEATPLLAVDVTLDLDRAVEAAPAGSRQAVRTWIDTILPEGVSATGRVWLDASDRVHRFVLLEHDGELDLRLSDHGEPVDIPIPAPEAIVDPDQLAELLPDLGPLPDPPPSGWDEPDDRPEPSPSS